MYLPRTIKQIVRRRGMVAVLAALSLVMLIGAAALAVDGGAMLVERRHAQATADAAALAAASDLFLNYPQNNGLDSGGTAATSAQTVATGNGYTNDGTTNSVTVRVPGQNYLGGPNAGSTLPAGYVEVTVTWQQTPTLSKVFSSANMPISARAVARGLWVPAKPQIIAFDLATPGSLTDNSVGNVQVMNGSVVANSSSSTAAQNNSPGASFSAGIRSDGQLPGEFQRQRRRQHQYGNHARP